MNNAAETIADKANGLTTMTTATANHGIVSGGDDGSWRTEENRVITRNDAAPLVYSVWRYGKKKRGCIKKKL